MEKLPIQNRRYGTPTEYYPSGKFREITGIGNIPQSLKMKWNMVEGHEDARCTETYRLSVVTKDFVYYLRDDADEISGTVMLNIHLQLVSDNYFGCQDLISVVLENKDIVWMSKKAKEWQRVYTDISEQPPDVKNALLKVNVACLNDEERKIYHAYKNIGPAKYTKSECLMAVISNQLESYSPELASIIKLLDEAHGKS